MLTAKNTTENNIVNWIPVLTLALCVFVFNTSEFIPIGLLSDISSDFDITEAQTGWLVTIYAWVVATLSLPLMLLTSQMGYRKLMLFVVCLFIVSHFFSFASSEYWLLVCSRIGVACSHAIFWSIVTPLAVEVAPPRKKSTAISMIVVGSSVAMIVGLPLGRLLGLYLGWRITFLSIGLIALLALFCLFTLFPKVQCKNSIALRDVPTLLTQPSLISIYILTPLIMTGNFTVYSYIEPFLNQVGGITPNLITSILLAYGAVGLLSSWLFSKFYDRHPLTFIKVTILGIPLALFLFNLTPNLTAVTVIVCIGWGFFVTLYNLVFQSLILLAAPKGSAIAMSVYSGIYNIGIGSGAFVGGLVCSKLTIEYIGYIGSAIATLGSLFCLIILIPIFKTLIKTKFH